MEYDMEKMERLMRLPDSEFTRVIAAQERLAQLERAARRCDEPRDAAPAKPTAPRVGTVIRKQCPGDLQIVQRGARMTDPYGATSGRTIEDQRRIIAELRRAAGPVAPTSGRTIEDQRRIIAELRRGGRTRIA